MCPGIRLRNFHKGLLSLTLFKRRPDLKQQLTLARDAFARRVARHVTREDVTAEAAIAEAATAEAASANASAVGAGQHNGRGGKGRGMTRSIGRLCTRIASRHPHFPHMPHSQFSYISPDSFFSV